MSRDRTRTRERAAGEAAAPEFDREPDAETAESVAEEGLTTRVGRRAGRVFSPRAFLAALVVTVAGLVAGSAVVPLPGAGLLGVFLATFLFGLLQERRRYGETLVAGGLAVGVSAMVGHVVVAAFGGFGVPLAAVAGGVGGLVGAAGHYFGRDLRAGMTRTL
jgi:hypothetical protein